MYTYEIRYSDNTTGYVNATDFQNACSEAGCRADEIVSVRLLVDLPEEELLYETNN